MRRTLLLLPAGMPTSSTPRAWLRPLLVIAAAVVVLTVAATTVVLLLGGPRQASYAPGSPEQALQSFVAAAHTGDYPTADSYLSTRLRASGVSSSRGHATTYDLSLSIDSVSVSGDTAKLRVSITRTYSIVGLGTSTSTYQTMIVMVREAGRWKLDSDEYGLF